MSNRVIPLEVPSAQGNQEYGLNIKAAEPNTTHTYSTPLDICMVFGASAPLIAGFGLICYSIVSFILDRDKEKLMIGLAGLFFTVIGIFVGSSTSLYTSITVDYKLGIINIKTKKISFCFSKSKDIQINQVKKIIVRNDYNTTFKIRKYGRRYFAFEIFFILADGSEVEGCSGLMDQNNEGKKAFSFLRSTLPKNIIFSGNIVRSRKRRRRIFVFRK